MAKRKQEIALRGGTELDLRMQEYSAVTRGPQAGNQARSRVGNWRIYAAATGSAFAMATSASANIFTGTYSSVTVQPGPGGQSSIKGLFFGTPEVNIKAISGFLSGNPFAALSLSGNAAMRIFDTTVNHQNVRNFLAGSKISSGAGPATANPRIVNAVFSGLHYGNFVSDKPGFAGLALKTALGGVDYGWLKLKFTEDPLTHLPQILTAISFGIEQNPGQAIRAGQTSDATTTPEPNYKSLLFLASGAAAIVALRRRRKETAA